MRYLSVCSGIEAATVAWHPLGWTPAAFAEIEPFPRAVLAHHYPEVPLHGDFTTIKGHEYGAVDLLVGGTPCQSFSVAGLRKGLDDPRGNLMLEYGALAKRLGAKWLVWENVPGVLSSNEGRDFGAFLGMLVELGYGFAYRVLDAQYFGVPQRRRRVFVVACLGDWRAPAAVLFERHSLQGNLAPSRQARQDAAIGVIGGIDYEGNGHGVGDPTGPLLKGSPSGGGHPLPAVVTSVDVCPTLRAGGNKTGGDRPPGTDVDTADSLIVLSVALRGRDGGGDKAHVPAPYAVRDIAGTLTGNYGKQVDNSDTALGPNVVIHPTAFAIQAGALRENPASGPDGLGVQPHIAYTLEARTEVQVVAFAASDYKNGMFEECDIARALTTSADRTRGAPITASMAFAQNTRDEVRLMGGDGEVAGALAAQPGMKQTTYVAPGGMAVRRLTPRECERLQGFPDDYTSIPMGKRKKKAEQKELTDFAKRTGQDDIKWSADGPRYKALGNSMAVPCMAWIGSRIQAVIDLQQPMFAEGA